MSLNFDDQYSRQGPQKPQDGFEIDDESKINDDLDFDDDDLDDHFIGND